MLKGFCSRVQGLGLKVQGARFSSQVAGRRVQGSGFGVGGLWLRFGVWGLVFRVEGKDSGFRL